MAAQAGALGAPIGVERRTPDARFGDRVLFGALLVGLTAAVVLVYALLHRRLAIEANAVYARIDPVGVATHPGRDAVRFSFGPFLAVLAGSIVLAALRHRIAAFAIFVLAAATPLLQSVFGVLPVEGPRSFRVAPTPLGAFWTNGIARPPLGQLWRAAATDYALALLPALAIVLWTARPGGLTLTRVRTAATRATVVPLTAAFACSAFLYWLVLHTWELRESLRGTSSLQLGTDLVAFSPFFALGLALSRGSRWRFVALVAVPVLWSTAWIPSLLAGDGIHGPTGSDLHGALPYLGVVAAGACWRPIAGLLSRHAPFTPWTLVAALNALNLADVLFTSAALRSHQAVEANPFATVIGPVAKLAGVAAASVLLARFKPRALVWLVVVMSLVIAWHLGGLALDTA